MKFNPGDICFITQSNRALMRVTNTIGRVVTIIEYKGEILALNGVLVTNTYIVRSNGSAFRIDNGAFAMHGCIEECNLRLIPGLNQKAMKREEITKKNFRKIAKELGK